MKKIITQNVKLLDKLIVFYIKKESLNDSNILIGDPYGIWTHECRLERAMC